MSSTSTIGDDNTPGTVIYEEDIRAILEANK